MDNRTNHRIRRPMIKTSTGNHCSHNRIIRHSTIQTTTISIAWIPINSIHIQSIKQSFPVEHYPRHQILMNSRDIITRTHDVWKICSPIHSRKWSPFQPNMANWQVCIYKIVCHWYELTIFLTFTFPKTISPFPQFIVDAEQNHELQSLTKVFFLFSIDWQAEYHICVMPLVFPIGTDLLINNCMLRLIIRHWISQGHESRETLQSFWAFPMPSLRREKTTWDLRWVDCPRVLLPN